MMTANSSDIPWSSDDRDPNDISWQEHHARLLQGILSTLERIEHVLDSGDREAEVARERNKRIFQAKEQKKREVSAKLMDQSKRQADG